ncbi:MAG: substrate-binding domain-containing protein, partial [Victivallales bacterium]|nr:substrate-binding domain-containing protein [Victivallales bacterium]
NQPSAVGAYKAIQAQGKAGTIKYVGFDSDSLLVQAIEDGSCVGLIVQDPLQIGFIGVETAVKLLNGETPPRDIPVPSMVVTIENLAEKKQTHAAALGL